MIRIRYMRDDVRWRHPSLSSEIREFSPSLLQWRSPTTSLPIFVQPSPVVVHYNPIHQSNRPRLLYNPLQVSSPIELHKSRSDDYNQIRDSGDRFFLSLRSSPSRACLVVLYTSIDSPLYPLHIHTTFVSFYLPESKPPNWAFDVGGVATVDRTCLSHGRVPWVIRAVFWKLGILGSG